MSKISLRIFLVAVAATFTVPAFTVPALAQEFRAGNIIVTHPWMRATAKAKFAATVLFDITLTGTEHETLLGATSPMAGVVDIREAATFDSIYRSVRVEKAQIPPGSYRLSSDHIHLMLLQAPILEEGTTVPVTLLFENAGELEIQVPVLNLRAMDPRPPL